MVTAYQPRTLEEALAIRSERQAIALAGGTDLLVRNRSWSGTQPAIDRPVLFLNRIDALRTIERSEHTITIGAAVTLTELLETPALPPDLRSAITQMASPAIRNAATLGGNICNASPAADTLPSLYAADAIVRLQRPGGQRDLPVRAFITGPGQTVLVNDELLTAIQIPITPFNRVIYRKVGTRKANALSKLSFVGLAQIEASTVQDIRIAFGAVAPIVVREPAFESLLIGMPLSDVPAHADAVCRHFAERITPIDDQRSTANYRKTTALRLLANFLSRLSMPDA
jgi:CO/xanthine dehydrogenase FAD-binding subunit